MSWDGPPTELTPSLFIGSDFNAANRLHLLQHNITAILNTGYPQSQNYFIHETPIFNYSFIEDISDLDDEDLLEAFDGAIEWLEREQSEGRVVLVHCAQGRSRSVAICVPALMRQKGLSLVDALNYIRERRVGVKPDSALLQALVKWDLQHRSAPALSDEELQKRVDEFARECGYVTSIWATRQQPPAIRTRVPSLSTLVLRRHTPLVSSKLIQPSLDAGPSAWSHLHEICSKFSRTDVVGLARVALYRDLEKRIKQSNLHQTEGDSFVPAALTFSETHLNAANSAFPQGSTFGLRSAVAQAMRFLTADHLPSNAQLARHMHRILSSQQSTDEKISALRRILPQLRFLNDLDAFADAYAPLYAQRLVKQYDKEAEEVALAVFPRARMNLLVSRLELLRKEVDVGRQIAAQFAAEHPTTAKSLEVLPLPAHRCPTSWIRGPDSMVVDSQEVLQGGAFGLSKSSWPKECILPAGLDALWLEWYRFWRERFPDKLIAFLPHMGTAEIKVTLHQTRFTLVVPTPLMSILLLFNRATSHSYEYIVENSGLSASLTNFALRSLLALKAGGQALLSKKPGDSSTFADSDVFELNSEFKPSKKLLKFG